MEGTPLEKVVAAAIILGAIVIYEMHSSGFDVLVSGATGFAVAVAIFVIDGLIFAKKRKG